YPTSAQPRCPTSALVPWASAQPVQPFGLARTWTASTHTILKTQNRLGRLGRLGRALRRTGFQLPNLCPTSPEVGQCRVPRGSGGTRHVWRGGGRGSSRHPRALRVARPQFACIFPFRVWFRWYRVVPHEFRNRRRVHDRGRVRRAPRVQRLLRRSEEHTSELQSRENL